MLTCKHCQHKCSSHQNFINKHFFWGNVLDTFVENISFVLPYIFPDSNILFILFDVTVAITRKHTDSYFFSLFYNLHQKRLEKLKTSSSPCLKNRPMSWLQKYDKNIWNVMKELSFSIIFAKAWFSQGCMWKARLSFLWMNKIFMSNKRFEGLAKWPKLAQNLVDNFIKEKCK